MYKEMAICIILVILIIIVDIVTQNYTKSTVNYMTGEIKELNQKILSRDTDGFNEELEKIDGKWSKTHDKLAYYIEHDELEKVETTFTAGKSLAIAGEYNQAISELEKTIYVLDHITDKYSFNWINIF